MLAAVYEQSSNGFVPSVTSVPFVTPSPSQSAAFHAALGATAAFANTNEHGSCGSVPSASSVAFVTPSPSQSPVGRYG